MAVKPISISKGGKTYPQFYVDVDLEFQRVYVYHRRMIAPNMLCATFHIDEIGSKTRALKAAKIFAKQMNSYYPARVPWKEGIKPGSGIKYASTK